MKIAVAGGTGVVGTYVVSATLAAGHEPVVLSRGRGVDVITGQGLDRALEGVEVIIDVANSGTINRQRATEFFTQSTRHLHEAGARHHVQRSVVLSIVGVDRISGNGYYQAKLAHERAALHGPLPTTVVRSTQFHEFGAQMAARTHIGPVALVPVMKVQPVAARSVGEILVEVAGEPTTESILEVAGPRPESLVAMAKATMSRRGERLVCLPLLVPGAAGRAMRDGSQCPTAEARVEGPDFASWLASADALVAAS
jgi:uncharacterized protein YbjT (DUF2867 family)